MDGGFVIIFVGGGNGNESSAKKEPGKNHLRSIVTSRRENENGSGRVVRYRGEPSF